MMKHASTPTTGVRSGHEGYMRMKNTTQAVMRSMIAGGVVAAFVGATTPYGIAWLNHLDADEANTHIRAWVENSSVKVHIANRSTEKLFLTGMNIVFPAARASASEEGVDYYFQSSDLTLNRLYHAEMDENGKLLSFSFPLELDVPHNDKNTFTIKFEDGSLLSNGISAISMISFDKELSADEIF